MKMFDHTEQVTQTLTIFLVGARLIQRIVLITRNQTENRERWNVDKFDETDDERYYQQEVQ